ncbi:MAG: hypothetical protein HY934_09600 [Candidatus Firestonebacteria bacterium]|nr:hypothetical protein [Candidatus Firestonebacteria bacterium]
MSTITKQANFLLPVDLLVELKRIVGVREQSKVVAEALKKELKRIKLENVIQSSFGAWQDINHPELEEGTNTYIRQIRKSTRTSRLTGIR